MYSKSPYGKVLREYNESTDARYLTTHHERDKETGFDYRGARFYDSDLGRFLSLDPLAREYPSYSDYSYVLGNPISLIDPTGMAAEDWFVNNKTGSLIYKKGVSELSKEDVDVGDVQDYERLGSDDMFDTETNKISDDNFMYFNPQRAELLAKTRGYDLTETKIVETTTHEMIEFEPIGRMAVSTSNSKEFNKKLTYMTPEQMNTFNIDNKTSVVKQIRTGNDSFVTTREVVANKKSTIPSAFGLGEGISISKFIIETIKALK